MRKVAVQTIGPDRMRAGRKWGAEPIEVDVYDQDDDPPQATGEVPARIGRRSLEAIMRDPRLIAFDLPTPLLSTPAQTSLSSLTKGENTMPNATAPSDSQVAAAYRAAISGEQGGRQIALSAVGGPTQATAVLDNATDLQMVKALNPTEMETARTLLRTDDPQLIARNARAVARTALARSQREDAERAMSESRSRYVTGAR